MITFLVFKKFLVLHSIYFSGGDFLEPVDINELLKMISKMDKKDLEDGLKKAQTILNNQATSTPDNSKEK